jgi:hypothetical protein
MAQAELIDLGSSVNQEGLALRLDLDRQVRRCFYVVPQVMTPHGHSKSLIHARGAANS